MTKTIILSAEDVAECRRIAVEYDGGTYMEIAYQMTRMAYHRHDRCSFKGNFEPRDDGSYEIEVRE